MCDTLQDYDSDKSFTIGDGSISQLLPSCCLDRIVKVYAKKPELVCEKYDHSIYFLIPFPYLLAKNKYKNFMQVAAVSDAFENFQEQKYGRKTQVHGTPQKKKQRKLWSLQSSSTCSKNDQVYITVQYTTHIIVYFVGNTQTKKNSWLCWKVLTFDTQLIAHGVVNPCIFDIGGTARF